MKKYLAGFLLIAALAVVGGLKLINEKSVSAESVPCGQTSTGPQVGDCYGGMRCTNTGQATGGVWVLSASCGAISAGGSGVVSALTSTRPVLTWTTSPGASYYVVEISDRADFSNIIVRKQVTTNSLSIGQ